jgi:hypothetical protein
MVSETTRCEDLRTRQNDGVATSATRVPGSREGGDASQLGRLVIGQGLAVVAIGVVLGLGTTFFTSKTLSSVLFGVSATDRRRWPWCRVC